MLLILINLSRRTSQTTGSGRWNSSLAAATVTPLHTVVIKIYELEIN